MTSGTTAPPESRDANVTGPGPEGGCGCCCRSSSTKVAPEDASEDDADAVDARPRLATVRVGQPAKGLPLLVLQDHAPADELLTVGGGRGV